MGNEEEADPSAPEVDSVRSEKMLLCTLLFTHIHERLKREHFMCMALTPSDHFGSCSPEAKWQPGREREREREDGREAVLYQCVKSEPSSKLVYKQESV